MVKHYIYVLLDQSSNSTYTLPPQPPPPQCSSSTSSTSSTDLPLRVAAIFVILVGSLFGALFPVLARRTKAISKRLPKRVFDTAKYFGSGVIIGTAFIHLLNPAIDELSSPCLDPAWQEYPYAIALALISIFSIFVVELIALRWGTAKLAHLGVEAHSEHSHSHAPSKEDVDVLEFQVQPQIRTIGDLPTDRKSVSSGEVTVVEKDHKPEALASKQTASDVEAGFPNPAIHPPSPTSAAATQLVGIAILEFGVLLHSFLIGLTLAVTDGFKILFVVLCLHQTFEGLGVGSRLAYLEFPSSLNDKDNSKRNKLERWVPIWCAVVFGVTTPFGIAIGLGFRSTYNPESATASIVSGVLDSFSAGVLIYTGLVELLAHDFIFNPAVTAPPPTGSQPHRRMSDKELAYAIGCVMLGCGGMAVLGRWA